MGLTIPNLDDKNFDELVEEARSLIARYGPEWTDHNVHDPGITFIELFAWLAEMQIYQLNQVTDSHYEKFLELAGFSPMDIQPARVDITFKNEKNEKTLPAGTQIITESEGEEIVFETEHDCYLFSAKLEKVITKYDSQTIDNTDANEREDVYFAVFGENAPQGAELLLGFNKRLPPKEISINFILFEEDLPLRNNHSEQSKEVHPPATLEWEYLDAGKWAALTTKKDTTLALTKNGRVVFEGPSSLDKKNEEKKNEDKELFWIRCRLKEGHYEIAPRVNRILLNTVTAVQMEKIEECLGKGSGKPQHVVVLERTPFIRRKQAGLIVQTQEDNGEYEDWKEVENFESSDPDDPHYVFNQEERIIVFGNGLNGRLPSKSQWIKAIYKTTLGLRGNIFKRQKFWINKDEFRGIWGTNLMEATEGKSRESIAEAKARIKKDFKTSYRAITSEDYEKLACSTPGLRVNRAKAIPNYNPDYPCVFVPGAVTVVVVPHVRNGKVLPVPGEGFCQTILHHLNRHRLITTDVFVIGPEYVKVSIECKIRIKKKRSPSKVKECVNKALTEFLNPLREGQEKKGWPIGRSVYLSEIYQVIDKVPGVDYATDVSISTKEQYKKTKDAAKIPPHALVYSGDHQVDIL